MVRSRKYDLESILQALLSECPQCQYKIPPGELEHLSQDHDLVTCPKCQHEFTYPRKRAH